jgi:hypothetical protein
VQNVGCVFFVERNFFLFGEINRDTIMLGIDWEEENVAQLTLIGRNEEQFSKRGCAVCFSS